MEATAMSLRVLPLERGHEERIKIVSEVDNDGMFPIVCFVHGVGNRQAFADLMVKAVNRFDKLVEHLERMEKRCGILTDEEFGYGRSRMMMEAQAALKPFEKGEGT